MSYGFMLAISVVMWIICSTIACVRVARAASGKTKRNYRRRGNYYDTFGDEIWQQQKRESERFMRDMDQQQFMEFSEKSVTPFEAGGFNMNFGNSFNDFGGMF